MNAVSKPWFAEDGAPFNGSEPFYFNTDDFAWVKQVEAQWQTIRDELYALIEDDTALTPYANRMMTSRPNQWKTFGMMFWSVKHEANCRRAPRTWEILKNVPNICAISFNLLEPNTTIKPHNGDTNAIIRCHMGLEVPAAAPRCAFRVGSEIRSWEDGKFLMFCDAHEHTAWNNTERRRYILVVDVMRPEYVALKRRVSSRVLASISLQIYYQRFAWLKRYAGGRFGKAAVTGLLRALSYLPLSRSAA